MDVRKVMYSTYMYYANPTENESGAWFFALSLSLVAAATISRLCCWMVFLLSVVATLELLSSAVCTYVYSGMAHICAATRNVGISFGVRLNLYCLYV